jgi:hypothetical protein
MNEKMLSKEAHKSFDWIREWNRAISASTPTRKGRKPTTERERARLRAMEEIE